MKRIFTTKVALVLTLGLVFATGTVAKADLYDGFDASDPTEYDGGFYDVVSIGYDLVSGGDYYQLPPLDPSASDVQSPPTGGEYVNVPFNDMYNDTIGTRVDNGPDFNFSTEVMTKEELYNIGLDPTQSASDNSSDVGYSIDTSGDPSSYYPTFSTDDSGSTLSWFENFNTSDTSFSDNNSSSGSDTTPSNTSTSSSSSGTTPVSLVQGRLSTGFSLASADTPPALTVCPGGTLPTINGSCSINITPSLVRKDATTKIYFFVKNLDKGDVCAVMSSPFMSGLPTWSGSGKIWANYIGFSVIITQKTIFTLTCKSTNGSISSVSKTVNITPTLHEI